MTNHLFLILNSSMLWCMITAFLIYLFKSKSFTLVIILAPYIIGSAFRNSGPVQSLLDNYLTVLLYGFPGIILATIYMEFKKAKSHWQKIHKPTYVARLAITFSSIYLLTYFAQQTILENPLVHLAFQFSNVSDPTHRLETYIDPQGMKTAIGTIIVSLSVILINQYKQRSQLESNGKEAITNEK